MLSLIIDSYLKIDKNVGKIYLNNLKTNDFLYKTKIKLCYLFFYLLLMSHIRHGLLYFERINR